MKLKYYLTALFFILLFAKSDYSQQNNYNVKSFEINDSLKISDPVDAQLGRVNNFEIYLSNNDFISIEFSTDNFIPLILFVSPSGSKNVYNSKDGKNINFTQKIDETGNWELYVIGGKKGFGAYKCRINFADSSALIKNGNLSECSFFKFLSEHSEANFIFIKDLVKNKFSNLRTNSFSVDSSYINNNSSLMLILKTEKPSEMFRSLSDKLKNCFPDWKFRIGKLRKISDNYVQVTSLIEMDKKAPRFIKLTLTKNGSFTNQQISAEFGKINE